MLLRYSLQLEAEAHALEAAVVAGHRIAARLPADLAAARHGLLRRVQPPMRCWLDSVAARSRPGARSATRSAGIFDADRNPQQPRTDAGTQPRRFLHAGMSHARRMGDQTLHPAQRLGEREAFEPREKRLDGGLAAGELETQHRAEAALLAARDFVARMMRQARVVHALRRPACLLKKSTTAAVFSA